MPYKHLLFLIFLLQCGRVFAQHERVEKVVDGVKIRFTLVDYGIGRSDAKKAELDTSSPTQSHTHGQQFTVSQKTDKIPGDLGVEFGVNYEIETNVDSDISVTHVWVFPKPIFNPHFEKRFKSYPLTTTVTGTYSGYSAYTFEKYFEIVTGEWQLQFYYKEQLLYSKSFWVQ